MAQSPFISSAGMSLPIPVVGLAPGPDYAGYINNALSILDQHTHAAGSGVQITPDGINITGPLAFNGSDATLLRSIRYTAQATVLTGATDVGCTYVTGVDLYYRDVNGNNIRITQSAGVAGTPGSIANLTSPASASYVGGSQTFVWQSGANLPANLDAGSIIVRNLSVNSNGITVSAPNALAANYVLTLPASPATSTKIVTMDSTGALSPGYDVDQSSLTIGSGLLQVKTAGITASMLAAGTQNSLTSVLMTASGPFVVPSLVTVLYAFGVGGGGGGGAGAYGNGGSGTGAGGGGGEGAYPYYEAITVVPGETLTVTVGAGGAGAPFGYGTGTSGGATTIMRGSSTIFIAVGGLPGSSGSGSAGAPGGSRALYSFGGSATMGGAGGNGNGAPTNGNNGFSNQWGSGGGGGNGTTNANGSGGGGGGGAGFNILPALSAGGPGGSTINGGNGNPGAGGGGYASGGGGGAGGNNNNNGGAGGAGTQGLIRLTYLVGK